MNQTTAPEVDALLHQGAIGRSVPVGYSFASGKSTAGFFEQFCRVTECEPPIQEF